MIKPPEESRRQNEINKVMVRSQVQKRLLKQYYIHLDVEETGRQSWIINEYGWLDVGVKKCSPLFN